MLSDDYPNDGRRMAKFLEHKTGDLNIAGLMPAENYEKTSFCDLGQVTLPDLLDPTQV